MTKIRTALLALTVSLAVAGGTGAMSPVDAKAPVGKDTTTVVTAKKSGDSWCC